MAVDECLFCSKRLATMWPCLSGVGCKSGMVVNDVLNLIRHVKIFFSFSLEFSHGNMDQIRTLFGYWMVDIQWQHIMLVLYSCT